MTDQSTSTLVAAARAGSREAWHALVDRYARLVWAVIRGHGIGGMDAADISQTAWLRLVEHLDRLRDPDQVGSWLAATTRHECLRFLNRRGREHVTESLPDHPSVEPTPEEHVVAADRDRLLAAALAQLPPRCRVLLRALTTDPTPSYAELAAALDVPIGSLGPTRSRCLARLRELLAALGHEPDVESAGSNR